MEDDAARKQLLEGISSSVVNQHVQLSTVLKEGNDSDKLHVKRKQKKDKQTEDQMGREANCRFQLMIMLVNL